MAGSTDPKTDRPTKAQRERLDRLHRAEALEADLVCLDSAVFKYPIELKSAGDLRLWIGHAVRELRHHQEIARD